MTVSLPRFHTRPWENVSVLWKIIQRMAVLTQDLYKYVYNVVCSICYDLVGEILQKTIFDS